MPRFSQRHGYVPVRLELQVGMMDRGLRLALWNWFADNVITMAYRQDGEPHMAVITDAWVDVLQRPLDELPDHPGTTAIHFKRVFLKGEWYGVVDIVELCGQELGSGVQGDINSILADQLAGYRFIDGQVAEITEELQVSTVNAAVEAASDGLDPARKHLSRAVELFSHRPSPDFRNTVKEALSAAESAARIATGARDFNDAMKQMVATGVLHPAMQKAMSSLFGYGSDEQGVRHGFTSAEDKVDYPEALFVLVTCSAFLSYVAEHVRE